MVCVLKLCEWDTNALVDEHKIEKEKKIARSRLEDSSIREKKCKACALLIHENSRKTFDEREKACTRIQYTNKMSTLTIW